MYLRSSADPQRVEATTPQNKKVQRSAGPQRVNQLEGPVRSRKDGRTKSARRIDILFWRMVVDAGNNKAQQSGLVLCSLRDARTDLRPLLSFTLVKVHCCNLLTHIDGHLCSGCLFSRSGASLSLSHRLCLSTPSVIRHVSRSNPRARA